MLTRLQVRGFKNLVDVDVRFGPFTCIAGPNGVGKSNIFDAILFLSELADKPFVEAARNIRGGESLGGLFSVHGDKRMYLAAEMLIPQTGEDEFQQRTEASATFVRYELELTLQPDPDSRIRQRIRLEREYLTYIKKGEARQRLSFPCASEWVHSVVQASRRSTPFISTKKGKDRVRLHWDRLGSSGGRPPEYSTSALPRTVLSSARHAHESRTAILVRQEMRHWRLLQLEPSAMRQPDDFESEDSITATGSHIPATLYRITSSNGDPGHKDRIYAAVANRLAELVEGVRAVWVDQDDKRRVLTLVMSDRYGLQLPASALSDGTMRFVALTVLQQDPRESGLICLEEPENGIHPQRIDAMLQLLNDIAVDTEDASDDENPLRQIIINTHSPIVAGRIYEGDLLFAQVRTRRTGRRRMPELNLACLDETWRANLGMETISKGRVLGYLRGAAHERAQETRKRRVIDRFHPGQRNLFGDGA